MFVISGATVSFKSDPFGRRIYKSSSSGTSVYAYDWDNLVEETNSTGTAAARYLQDLNIDEPLAMLRSSTTSYYQADGLGSLTSLSNTSGALANTYVYDSFGNLTASTGSLTNSFRYTGREFDTETGLYYYRARYYDPQPGRFLSEDPAYFRSGPNFYAYSLNNPINLRDPSGKTAAAVAVPVAEGVGTLVCFGSGVCETIIIGTAAVVAVAATGYAVYNWFESRSRGRSDPIPYPGTAEPGPCDKEKGKCNPCPPDSPYWDQPGNAHGSTTGVHYHWYHYNQTPYPDCKCYPVRLDGPTAPPGGTPWNPGGPQWP
jgi:RHS repeat-associated protein